MALEYLLREIIPQLVVSQSLRRTCNTCQYTLIVWIVCKDNNGEQGRNNSQQSRSVEWPEGSFKGLITKFDWNLIWVQTEDWNHRLIYCTLEWEAQMLVSRCEELRIIMEYPNAMVNHIMHLGHTNRSYDRSCRDLEMLSLVYEFKSIGLNKGADNCLP